MSLVFFFDVDGTMIDCPRNIFDPTEKTLYALKQLSKKGHKVFLASGRPYCFLSPMLKSFSFDGYINSNGSSIEMNDQIMYQRDLEPEIILRTLVLAEEHHFCALFETRDKVFVTENYDHRMNSFYAAYDLNDQNRGSDFDSYTLKAQKFSFYMHDDHADIQWLAGEYQDYAVTALDQDVYDLSHRSVSKATAIKRVMNALDLDLSFSVAFGDGENDSDMLQTAGKGIAMGSASDRVKAAAGEHALSVAEEGIYHYLIKNNIIE